MQLRYGVLLLLSLCLACGSERSEPKNLILISLDTCRADRLSCYGAPRETSPHLDALAAESVRFTDCLAQSCVTSPSHMSIFTGQYVNRHGVHKNGVGFTPKVPLAEALRARGWQTAAFTGHGSLITNYGHDKGFETFQSWDGEPTEPYQRTISEVLPHALSWLDDHQEEPFFLLVHGYDPHCPYIPPEPWRSEFAGWYDGDYRPESECSPPHYRRMIDEGVLQQEDLRYLSDLYDAEIRSADQDLGGFFEELRRRGLLENSILVFLSDHGESLGLASLVGHGRLYERVLQVPLLMRFPDRVEGKVVDAPVQLIDVMPTLLSAMEVIVPEGVQGVDLMPLVRNEGNPLPDNRLRIAQAKRHFAARMDDRWKIHFTYDRGEVYEPFLYDLENDPDELVNVLDAPGGQKKFAEIFQRFHAWKTSTREDDLAFRGQRLVARKRDSEASRQELEMLEALGYAGDEEN